MAMHLAEKSDDMTDEDRANQKAPGAPKDASKTPPAASLTAALIQRGHEARYEEEVEPIAPSTMPEATPESQPHHAEQPAGARAQQAILEEAFADPTPAVATAPIERAEFQSARDSAAHWRLRSGPSAGFWERLIKDVSIFTIFFAVLVFAILQTM